MKRAILFFYTLCISYSLFAMEIQVKNRTDYPCHVFAKLKDFNLLVNYQKPSGRIELPQHTDVILTLPASRKATGLSNILSFLVESGRIFKKTELSFPVTLGMIDGTCVPILIGKQQKSVTKLIGKKGFFVRKYMNDRHDTYILEICREEPRISGTSSVLSTPSIPDTVPLLSGYDKE